MGTLLCVYLLQFDISIPKPRIAVWIEGVEVGVEHLVVEEPLVAGVGGAGAARLALRFNRERIERLGERGSEQLVTKGRQEGAIASAAFEPERIRAGFQEQVAADALAVFG